LYTHAEEDFIERFFLNQTISMPLFGDYGTILNASFISAFAAGLKYAILRKSMQKNTRLKE
jgi:hypothetical protein